MKVNQLFKLYDAYKAGKTIICETTTHHSGYVNSYEYSNIKEVDFGELDLSDMVDSQEYSCGNEVCDTITKKFYVKE